jgi:predicted DNA-binding protein
LERNVGILTVRLTEEEEKLLAKRSRRAGMKKASFVRQLIREQPFETAADVVADAAKRMGDLRLRISRR